MQNTQLLYVRVLGAVFNQAIKDGIIKENPLRLFDRQELPWAVKQELPYLTHDEVKCLQDTPLHSRKSRRRLCSVVTPDCVSLM